MTAFAPKPCTLCGHGVRLEPLAYEHADGLLQAGREPSIWAFMPRPAFESLSDVTSFIDDAHSDRDAGHQVPFAIVPQTAGCAVGSTRFLDIRLADRGLEVGWTWLGVDWQRTAVNTACKALLLEHAFNDLGAHRVQLKTDARNVRSQAAIERIGGVREGILRQHMLLWDGHPRDSVYYSVLRDEWPDVRARLLDLVARKSGS
jgi:RimJ/RimL family protein N-acetyltransferase